MFASLQEKLGSALKSIRGKTVVSEKDLAETMRAVRMALLEADVNYKVAKDFCDAVSAKAMGESVLKSLTPDQQIIKIVHEQLVHTLGGEAAELNLRGTPPIIIMMVGLQGSGKTTTSAKLALLLKKKHKKKTLLVPADVYRPAAIQQLKTLASALDVDCYQSDASQDPVKIAEEACTYASNHGFDALIIDTAGRLQIDQEMMKELAEISDAVRPHEILLVVDAMTGQEAVNVAQGFDQALEIDGLVLTKLDGDARGGAALSIKSVTGKPIKFVGLGEKPDALDTFHPDRLASRILGMGDVLSLIEKASANISQEDTENIQNSLKKGDFSLEDFLGQLRMMKKMGSMESILGMLPGANKLMQKINPEEAERDLKRVEAIILSMTRLERRKPELINGQRRKRIANGSGTSVQDVNKLLKQFVEMRKMMKQLQGGGLSKIMNMAKGLGGLRMPR